MQALVESGSSANVTYFGESISAGAGRIYVACLCSTIERRDGEWRAKRVPTYDLTIFREGEGEVARTSWEPKRRPAGGAPSARTITRLVREAMR